ncbi:pneumococcal serine-rich repeat protein isoform X3 [Drosophila virilis]|uniref:pneumococcal serine-rich repeat protein isoform X3 n=1 Tax=Drosophila virilis TaxID=7244 RepID=UPI0038B28961
MLHKIDENAAPTVTSTPTTTTTATTSTTIMAPAETTGNGTEPTISTHLANATATIEPTTTTTITTTSAAAVATEQETVAVVVVAVAANAAVVVAAAAAEGQATETEAETATATMTVTANNIPTPLPLSAAAERTELATTADVAAANSASAASAASEHQPEAEPEPEPAAFDVQMRTQQQQKIRIYHGAKQSAVWRTDSLASNSSSSNRSEAGSTEVMATSRAHSGYSTAPSLLQRKFSDSSFNAATMPRRVSFPESDKELVTGYLEPANPWEKVCQVSSIAEISELYVKSCYKHHTQPLKNIMEHLKALDLHLARQPLLSLKGIQLTPNDCEPLEEIFMRIQYKAIDLSECPLNESCLSALCQMIEYYEAANELDISYNKEQMTVRGWGLCTHMVGRSQELQMLNAEGNQISKVGAENLGAALSLSNLHTLKLEHCGLKGPPLTNFCKCCKLYHNKILKELWLGYNDLDCTDAQHIADMLRFNHSIELIDISNNNIRDEGAMYLVQALILQATELERRSGLPLQRARAIEDDELVSPMETTASAQLAGRSEQCSSQIQSEAHATDPSTTPKAIDVLETVVEQQPAAGAAAGAAAAEEPSTSEPAVALLVDVDNDADDDNTETDTVRTLRSGNQSATGQSMLDKLLSMNSDSSSEEAPSNISTDTLAACCSEDISEISNDVYDAAGKLQSAAAATTSTDESTTTLVDPILDQLTPSIQQQQSSQTERNLCDITPSTEAKTVEPHETCVQNNNANSHNNNNNNNSSNSNNSNSNSNHNHNNNPVILNQIAATEVASVAVSSSGAASIFEVTAEESDCINGMAGPSGSRPLDMNKNAKNAGDDFEDTHSTDSAFESASEGDISRHLPDEFSRLSVSLESTRLDDMAKEMAIETATIASESTECLLVAEEAATPASTPTPVVHMLPQSQPQLDTTEVIVATVPKVTIAAKEKEPSASPCPSPTPTPPPPSTSPGGVSSGLRRTESSCAYLNQSTRNRSQSSDSLCSENSLDGSTSAADPHLAEKLTKNDTLSRRQLVDATLEAANRAPSGLKALALWSNNLTKECGPCIAELLSRSSSLELLNIGKNCLSNDFVATIKDSLTRNTTLTTLGLQSAHLSAKGIETLASILTFGGNSKLQRIDIRDNKLEVESLNIIAEVLKSNKTITQIDINDEPKRLTIGSDAHLDYTRVLGTVRSMCSRNEKMQAEELELAEKAANVGGGNSSNSSSSNNNGGSSNGTIGGSGIKNRCRGGYYLGSRKISLTCHSRPLVDAATGTVSAALAVTAMPTPAAKLEVKRKTNARLRSPGPSPPTISPSSSPNRSRFHVSRVNEIGSPLTSPLAQMPPQHPPTPRSASSCMSIPTASGVSSISSSSSSSSNGGIGAGGLLGSQSSLNAMAVLPLPTSSSLPSMASVTSSTQTVKRLSVSPRSRFHVSRIYEDPQTPPIHLPPTPMLKSARKAAAVAQLAEATITAVEHEPTLSASTMTTAATTTAMPISSVIIVEPSPTVADNENNAHQQSTNGMEPEQAAIQKLSPNSPSTSSSSCSTSPVSVSSATSSTSSGASNVTTDNTDNPGSPKEPATIVVAKSCPIAVFGDNDITLTKDSAAGAVLSAAASISTDAGNPPAESTPTATGQQQQQQQQQQQLQQPATRARKSSWIANPTTVDKLLTLFNPSAIFQRSSSPESKAAPASAVAPLTNNAQNITTTTTTSNAATGGSGDVNVTLLATRKTTPPARGNGGSNNATTTAAATAAGGAGSLVTGASGLETGAGSSSFLDTASRQLRDFGKQVFRQNLSFNNSGDGMGAAAQLDVNPSAVAMATSPILSNVAESPSPPECNAVHMPLSLKRELKENISPEHTINEETLHTLQKLSRVEDMTLKAEAAAELGDIEIVMHSEVSDMPEMEQQQQQQQQLQPTQQQQPQQEDLGAGLGR